MNLIGAFTVMFNIKNFRWAFEFNHRIDGVFEKIVILFISFCCHVGFNVHSEMQQLELLDSVSSWRMNKHSLMAQLKYTIIECFNADAQSNFYWIWVLFHQVNYSVDYILFVLSGCWFLSTRTKKCSRVINARTLPNEFS